MDGINLYLACIYLYNIFEFYLLFYIDIIVWFLLVKYIILLKKGGFFVLLIECKDIKKFYGDRLILKIDNLNIYSDDRIGIVGLNGSGKTTLINLLSRNLEPEEGWVKLYSKYEYVTQLENSCYKNISNEMASRFGIKTFWSENMSGGEKTSFKLAGALSNNSPIIFADEPTSNLDLNGVQIIEDMLMKYKGALVLVSHDRKILDKLCNRILEIKDGQIKIYNGNYSFYKQQKIHEEERVRFEYEEYVKEKKRLCEAVYETKEKVKSIKRTPKRMGNSEARLHKMGGQRAKSNLNRKVKNLKKRIDNLDQKEKPIEQPKIKIDFSNTGKIYNKIIIEGKKVNKVFGDNIIFDNADFQLYNGSKTALIGENGSGKSTLIKMIMNNEESIKIHKDAKIGYFSQDINVLNKKLNIFENVTNTSVYPESFARLLLARLLFKGEDIFKDIDMLSGGEMVKASFAKILLKDFNLLILDEPTNYLDINSLEVIEEALEEYDRTLLFVSHDRNFIDSLADRIMIIENRKIQMFTGTYKEYLSKKNSSDRSEDCDKKIIILQNRLSEVIGRLSLQVKKEEKEALEKEYYEILDKLKKLKESRE